MRHFGHIRQAASLWPVGIGAEGCTLWWIPGSADDLGVGVKFLIGLAVQPPPSNCVCMSSTLCSG